MSERRTRTAGLLAAATARWQSLAREERTALAVVVGFAALLLVGLLSGGLNLSYLLFVLALTGMYVLLTLGLNVQWGYAGLVNFSVFAFWGIGAYSAALLTSPRSPLGIETHPAWGLVVAVAASAVLATLIAIPTLRLRADYLAIATLGFAEIIRIIILNERAYTGGSFGVTRIPYLFEWLPVDQALVNFLLVGLLAVAAYLGLRRLQRSPWGRVLRTIRADEDLAQALGKNTFRFKLQAFVLGSVIMAVAGVYYVHLNRYLGPNNLAPIRTFYVWIGVIIGGTGSNRGAVLGGIAVVAILEGTRFANDLAVFQGFDIAPLRLLFVGLLVIVAVRFRPDGLLPPKREAIWPGSLEEDA